MSTSLHLFRSASDVASAATEAEARALVLRLEAELESRGVDLEAPRLPAGELGSALVCARDARFLLERGGDDFGHAPTLARLRARTGLAHLGVR
jgi:hypothetical protein